MGIFFSSLRMALCFAVVCSASGGRKIASIGGVHQGGSRAESLTCTTRENVDGGLARTDSQVWNDRVWGGLECAVVLSGLAMASKQRRKTDGVGRGNLVTTTEAWRVGIGGQGSPCAQVGWARARLLK